MINNILSILAIPEFDYYIYYINNGERHLCSRENLKKIIAQSSPTLMGQVNHFIARTLPFFVDVINNTVNEIDKKMNVSELRKKFINYNDIKSPKQDKKTIFNKIVNFKLDIL